MINVPEQKRGGFNQGEQTLVELQIRHAGQPAIKCGAGDTVLFQNAPVVSGNARGKDHVRATNAAPVGFAGMLYNLTTGVITFDTVIIDDEGNEMSMLARAGGNPAMFTIAAGAAQPLFALLVASGLLCLPAGWSVVLRVLTGSTTTGRGLVAWPWSHDMAHNVVPVILPLTTTLQEVGPAVGRGWQLASNNFNIAELQNVTPLLFPLVYANFDSVARSVAAEYFHLADEDVLTPAAALGPIGPIPSLSGVQPGFLCHSGVCPPFILCYPDTLKVRAAENQTTGPLYMFATFTEFDLPEDLG